MPSPLHPRLCRKDDVGSRDLGFSGLTWLPAGRGGPGLRDFCKVMPTCGDVAWGCSSSWTNSMVKTVQFAPNARASLHNVPNAIMSLPIDIIRLGMGSPRPPLLTAGWLQGANEESEGYSAPNGNLGTLQRLEADSRWVCHMDQLSGLCSGSELATNSVWNISWPGFLSIFFLVSLLPS